ncbi:ABC transporter ATP-binding protein [Paenibacillus sp. GSMTC-2017]|uniref:ABC transporter ATP-binding protein n=1 Tax=Paenibacillus sp. GSMTC-2017 TaxID=2794350 RepID=UPI0018D5D8B6|nr:ABC transporter ATP-binding protein [Paenibacillus sp. GSMTC-2017]MBH5320193.1 ABC transporter ATP-binding protein [Paenibacillus sp. GSMTC-2017]
MAGSTQELEKPEQALELTPIKRPAKIVIDQLGKVYRGEKKETVALQNINLTIYENEFICVVGPSGCGKTTLLNVIGGLEYATSGSVYVDGESVIGPGKERGVVFQQYALFPWKTVIENVEFGLKLAGLDKKTRRTKAEKYVEWVGLKDFMHAYPKELSGGMKQRVAIARAYAVEPKVLLLDEPFGALDAQTRAQLQEDLIQTWEKEKRTCFFITHDVEEAVLLANRVVVMKANPGEIKEMIDITLPYPRNQLTKLEDSFIQLKNEVWKKVYGNEKTNND